MKKSNENNIGMYLHCKICASAIPEGESPATHARIAVGWTPVGIQIWCSRHDINIMHIDFQGNRHPADLTIANKELEKQLKDMMKKKDDDEEAKDGEVHS